MIGCVPNSTVEDYSTPNAKVDGSNPANATESEKKLEAKEIVLKPPWVGSNLLTNIKRRDKHSSLLRYEIN